MYDNATCLYYNWYVFQYTVVILKCQLYLFRHFGDIFYSTVQTIPLYHVENCQLIKLREISIDNCNKNKIIKPTHHC